MEILPEAIPEPDVVLGVLAADGRFRIRRQSVAGVKLMVELPKADLFPFGLAHAVQFRGYYGIVPLLASSREKIANI